MSGFNPYDKFKPSLSHNVLDPSDVLRARPAGSPGEAAKREAEGQREEIPVSLPKHLYTPEGCQSLDTRRVQTIPAGTTSQKILEIRCPASTILNFLGYCIFNDGEDAAFFGFSPLVDGQRVFPFHGDPLTIAGVYREPYALYMGLAPDFGAEAVIPCQLSLQPGQVMEWYVKNLSPVAVDMGVRMIGYFDKTQKRINNRFGG